MLRDEADARTPQRPAPALQHEDGAVRDAQPCRRRHETPLPELRPDRESIAELQRPRAGSDLVERRLLGKREVVEMAEDPAPCGDEHEAIAELRREPLARELQEPVRVERGPEPSAVAGAGRYDEQAESGE